MNDRTTWLTMPDLVDELGLPVSRIRRLIQEHALPAKRFDGALRVPAEAIVGGAPQPDVRGTLIVLLDHGFSDDEAVDWLLGDEPSLGTTPIAALCAGRKAEVRRVAQALA